MAEGRQERLIILESDRLHRRHQTTLRAKRIPYSSGHFPYLLYLVRLMLPQTKDTQYSVSARGLLSQRGLPLLFTFFFLNHSD